MLNDAHTKINEVNAQLSARDQTIAGLRAELLLMTHRAETAEEEVTNRRRRMSQSSRKRGR